MWCQGDTAVEAWMCLKNMHGLAFNELEPSIRDEQNSGCAVHRNFEMLLQRGDSELGISPVSQQFGNAIAAFCGDSSSVMFLVAPGH